jgi:hypothetical protein
LRKYDIVFSWLYLIWYIRFLYEAFPFDMLFSYIHLFVFE